MLDTLVHFDPRAAADGAGQIARILESHFSGTFYVRATDTEQADRTITVIVRPGLPWVYVADDARGPFDRMDQIEEILWAELGRPSASWRWQDESLCYLGLKHGGNAMASVRATEQGTSRFIPNPIAADMAPWLEVAPPGTELVALQRLWDTAGTRASHQLRALAQFLQLPTQADLEPTPCRHELRLRLRACPPRQKDSHLPSGTFASLRQNPLQIPTFLCGPRRDAAKHLRRLWKAAIKQGSWNGLLEKLEYVPLDEAPGTIVTWPSESGEWMDPIWPILMAEELVELYSDYEHPIDRSVCQKLIVEGVEQFWICFGFFLRGQMGWRSHRELVPPLLERVLHWWPELCRLTSRMQHDTFTDPQTPNGWAGSATGWCVQMGLMTQEQHMGLLQQPDPFHIGEVIAGKIAAAKAAGKWPPQRGRSTQE